MQTQKKHKKTQKYTNTETQIIQTHNHKKQKCTIVLTKKTYKQRNKQHKTQECKTQKRKNL